MNRRSILSLVLGVVVGLCVLGLIGLIVGARMSDADYERWAREQFLTRHPEGKPLNWAIAEAAEKYRCDKPMGRFVLHENDCSDFVGCAVDHGLGAGARFERDSDAHMLCGEGGSLRRSLFVTRMLPDAGPIQPGDIIGVRHSPWYAPTEDSIGHVGVVGPEGTVLDFVKLKSWDGPRYGSSDLDWFIHNSAPAEVRVSRLRPEYRYGILDVTP